MIDRARIGYRTEPTPVAVDGWRVRLFCQAVGDADRDAADPVPPTFLKAVEGEHASSADLLAMLGVPLQRVLHAEQAFEIHAPVFVGDVVEVQRTLADVYERKGGALEFVVIDTTYRVRDALAATSRQTILVRHPAA